MFKVILIAGGVLAGLYVISKKTDLLGNLGDKIIDMGSHAKEAFTEGYRSAPQHT